MKRVAALLLVCLLVAGTASAISMSPGSAGASKTMVTTTAPHITKIPGAVVPVSITTTPGRGMLEVYSDPYGAAVTVSGAGSVSGTTPAKFSLYAGTYTVKVSLAGYKDYTETFTLTSGAIKDINADLQKIVLIPAPVGAQERNPEIEPGHAVTYTISTGAVTRKTTATTQITLTTPTTWVCPNSDWTCLTPAEAGQQFGYPNARYGEDPCGYTLVNDQYVFKYCYMDVDSGGELPRSALVATSIKEGDDIYIMNKTWIEHAVVNKSPVLQETEPATPFQSIFSFFNNLFGGGKVTPESRLQRVGLNPQPEPPAQDPLVQNAK